MMPRTCVSSPSAFDTEAVSADWACWTRPRAALVGSALLGPLLLEPIRAAVGTTTAAVSSAAGTNVADARVVGEVSALAVAVALLPGDAEDAAAAPDDPDDAAEAVPVDSLV